MKLLTYVPVLALSIATQSVWACMPLSPADAFVGRVQQVSPIEKDKLGNVYTYQFSDHKFVWRSSFKSLMYETPQQWGSHFVPKGIETNDLVIGLAYTPGGLEPNKYNISTLAKLTCQNDVITIEKPVEPNFGWNRDNQSCRHDNPTGVGVLDGFVDNGEASYLAQLQAKYPTCATLESAFPVVSDSVNDTSSLSFWERAKGWFGF